MRRESFEPDCGVAFRILYNASYWQKKCIVEGPNSDVIVDTDMTF